MNIDGSELQATLIGADIQNNRAMTFSVIVPGRLPKNIFGGYLSQD